MDHQGERTTRPTRILSIDGGGNRGLIPASFLACLERRLQERDGHNARLADYFDLFAGTSAGGLLVGLLLLPDRNVRLDVADASPPRPKMTAAEVLDFYFDLAGVIFHVEPLQWLERLGGLVDERYSSSGLDRAFDRAFGPPGSEPTLAELLRPTLIPTYRISVGEPYFFKQHQAAHGGRDFSLRDVGRATSAAPTFFEPVDVRSHREELGACIDGGVFANNPTMCAYVEARDHFECGPDDVAVLSVGTGEITRGYEYDRVRDWGAVRWLGPMLQATASGTNATVDHQLRQLFDDRPHAYLRLQADLTHEARATARMDDDSPSNLRRLVDIGRDVFHRHRDEIERFLSDHVPAPAPPPPPPPPPVRSHVVIPSPAEGDDVEGRPGPGTRRPSRSDVTKITSLVWLRRRNQDTVELSTIDEFRPRRVPVSDMPRLARAAAAHRHMAWAPTELMVPEEIPPEARLPRSYKLRYYGLATAAFTAYRRSPIDPAVPWDPAFPWNREFPPTRDGWQHPTSDATFARLRLQGPNPWLLCRVDDVEGRPTFELDFSRIFEGILPPVRARFVVDGGFRPVEIGVGIHTHRPGDATWARAKRVVNAADARYVAFGKHLLESHLIVGQAFALAAYRLPPTHRLRPFMQFFTYATLAVNDVAYRSLVRPGSYFVESGFVTIGAAERLFGNLVSSFDLGAWDVPADLEARGLHAVPDHPYVADAESAWPHFVDVVTRHLSDVGLDDDAVARDLDLQSWYLTLASLLPNLDARERLDLGRLTSLCACLLWNNVVHEIAGDLSPLLGSTDPADKSIVALEPLVEAIDGGRLDRGFPWPTAAEVFLVDQATFVSRFNVGGNNILSINAARSVDDPRLRRAIEHLQERLRSLESELLERNDEREVRFARMLPRHWEASISF